MRSSVYWDVVECRPDSALLCGGGGGGGAVLDFYNYPSGGGGGGGWRLRADLHLGKYPPPRPAI